MKPQRWKYTTKLESLNRYSKTEFGIYCREASSNFEMDVRISSISPSSSSSSPTTRKKPSNLIITTDIQLKTVLNCGALEAGVPRIIVVYTEISMLLSSRPTYTISLLYFRKIETFTLVVWYETLQFTAYDIERLTTVHRMVAVL